MPNELIHLGLLFLSTAPHLQRWNSSSLTVSNRKRDIGIGSWLIQSGTWAHHAYLVAKVEWRSLKQAFLLYIGSSSERASLRLRLWLSRPHPDCFEGNLSPGKHLLFILWLATRFHSKWSQGRTGSRQHRQLNSLPTIFANQTIGCGKLTEGLRTPWNIGFGRCWVRTLGV